MDKIDVKYKITGIKNGKKFHIGGVSSFTYPNGIPTILETDMNRIPKKKANDIELIIDGNEVVLNVNVDN